jgi:hypothetical protein
MGQGVQEDDGKPTLTKNRLPAGAGDLDIRAYCVSC